MPGDTNELKILEQFILETNKMPSYSFVDEHFLELVKFSSNSFTLWPSCFTPFVNVSPAVLNVIQCAEYTRLANMKRHG